MNYKKIYDDIIKRSKIRIILEDVHTETHHIIPTCMNGSNDDDNLVKLLLREHCLVHLLLMRIFPTNRKLRYSAWLMYNRWKKNGQYYSCREYEKLRIVHIKNMTGKNNPNFGKPHSKEWNQKISEAQKGEKCKLYGTKLKPVTIKKLSGKNNYGFGKHRSVYIREKISNTLMGHDVSENTRIKISDGCKNKEKPSLKGKPLSDNHKLKLSESHKGIPCSDSAKEKLSKHKKEWWKRKKYLSQKLKEEMICH